MEQGAFIVSHREKKGSCTAMRRLQVALKEI